MPCVFPDEVPSSFPRRVHRVRFEICVVIAISLAVGVQVTSTHAAQARCPSFTAPISYSAGTSPHSVAVGDLNGDGRLDLAIATSHPATLTIGVRRGDLNDDGVFDGLEIQGFVSALLEGQTCP